MSETKFTKGPWVKVKRRYDSAFAVETQNTGFGVCTTVLNEESDQYNAYLIAAAPEMYAMLERAKRCQEVADNEIEHSDLLHEIYDDIKTLLAKARGES